MSDAAAPLTAAERAAATQRYIMQALMPILLVVMLLGFSAYQPTILSGDNLLNILQQASYLAVFAAAQMVVILTRGFDLSLGSCVSSVSVLTSLIMVEFALREDPQVWLGIVLALPAGIFFGILVGLFNGFAVAVLRVNPFMATLASWNICYGIASTISGGRPVFDVPREFSGIIYSGTLLGIPIPIIITVVVLILIHLGLTRTVIGRSFYLLGSNPRASRIAGLPSRRYLIYAYIICSILAAVGAMMLTGRTGSGEPNLGGNLTLESIAAAVVGGVSLRGGIGGVPAVIIGALFITTLSNGMNLVELDGNVQMIVLGCVIIAAIFIDRLRTARR